MTLTNVFPWIERAFHEGWAVGAFNAVNMETGPGHRLGGAS